MINHPTIKPLSKSTFLLSFLASVFVSLTLITGCSTTEPAKKKQTPEKEAKEITIKVPESTKLEGKPCNNPDWTKLPPAVKPQPETPPQNENTSP